MDEQLDGEGRGAATYLTSEGRCLYAMTRAELDQGFSPDTIAECFEVPTELQTVLWGLVPHDQPTPGEDDYPEGPRFKPYAWVHHLTDSQFTTITAAIAAERM